VVLASAGFAPAAHTDTNLVNPWGIALSASSPFWIADNGTGASSLYDGSGNPQALVVTIPASGNIGATSPAPVTGAVFNGTSDFVVTNGSTTGPARFIFATEDGTIAAWNSGTQATLTVDNNNFSTGRVFKGLAIGSSSGSNYLYATDFRGGAVRVYDKNYAPATLPGSFADANLPAGFAPFGIANIGDRLYVTYALQNGSKHDDVAGPGNGYVDVFDTSGNLIRRLASQSSLNSPWGLALAPCTFGDAAGDLLVGNFGDGRINVINPAFGGIVGMLDDSSGKEISVSGLWGLAFGNGGTGGDPRTLYFTAGINHESDGLFGALATNNPSACPSPNAGAGTNPPGLPKSGLRSLTDLSGLPGSWPWLAVLLLVGGPLHYAWSTLRRRRSL